MHEHIEKFLRAANYLSAIQLYLQDNYLLTEPLRPEHIKERLLGHWGTCPGVNFVYAHMNRAIKEHNLNMLFVLGPGHGFPAIQANLFLEGTLSKYYESVPRSTEGIAYMAKQFSWPYGFPSHSNPGAPGVILEGGELGYSLSTSYGAVLDNPDLIVTCLVGDGEASRAQSQARFSGGLKRPVVKGRPCLKDIAVGGQGLTVARMQTYPVPRQRGCGELKVTGMGKGGPACHGR